MMSGFEVSFTQGGPLPVPPPQAGEGTLTIDFVRSADPTGSLPPLPRSGGGLGRGP